LLVALTWLIAKETLLILYPLPAENNYYFSTDENVATLSIFNETERVTAIIIIQRYLYLPWVRFIEISAILYSLR